MGHLWNIPSYLHWLLIHQILSYHPQTIYCRWPIIRDNVSVIYSSREKTILVCHMYIHLKIKVLLNDLNNIRQLEQQQKSFYQSFVQLKFHDRLNLILFLNDLLVFDQQLLLFLDNQPRISKEKQLNKRSKRKSFFTVKGKNDDWFDPNVLVLLTLVTSTLVLFIYINQENIHLNWLFLKLITCAMALPSLNRANSLIRNDILNKKVCFSDIRILNINIPTSWSNMYWLFNYFS